MSLDLALRKSLILPFPHFRAALALDAEIADLALAWLRDEAPWTLRVEDFYEQHEISLLDRSPGGAASALVSEQFVETVRSAIATGLPGADDLELVGVCAHRLTAGQTIRIHNDHIGDQETHRLLLQLNDGWDGDQGGLLLLFDGDVPETLVDVILPEHRSAFAFEISARSHHAVSTIKSGQRFTVVYTFRRRP